MKTAIKFTRSDYMDKRCSHREYFAQFVTSHVRSLVLGKFGIERLKANARDPHFNTIPLAEWDSFWVRHANGGMYIQPPLDVVALLRESGEGNSASTGTCILKEAARQLVEGAAS